MAIRKSTRRTQTEGADAAAFVKVIEDGLAEPEVVSAAYQQAIRESTAGQTYTELLNEVEVVLERPEVTEADRDNPTARMVGLARRFTFKGREGQ